MASTTPSAAAQCTTIAFNTTAPSTSSSSSNAAKTDRLLLELQKQHIHEHAARQFLSHDLRSGLFIDASAQTGAAAHRK